MESTFRSLKRIKKVLLPLNHNFNKTCDVLSFWKLKHKIIWLFLPSVRARLQLLTNMPRTVLLHCPISAEIRTADGQSDLRILLSLWLIEKSSNQKEKIIFKNSLTDISLTSSHQTRSYVQILLVLRVRSEFDTNHFVKRLCELIECIIPLGRPSINLGSIFSSESILRF